MSPPDLQESLRDLFGFSEFRPLQEDAVRAALAGRDLLLVMPTGAGKSLSFQLPAALTPGVTLVVSPLIALMQDQVMALRARTGFGNLGCAFINSTQSTAEQRRTVEQLRDGAIRLLYVAPERFRASGFVEAIRACKVSRLVVDEAHCISEWGHDFRPDYLALGTAVEDLGRPPLTAVTATATRRVQESIVSSLGMRDPAIFIGGFNRPNLHLSVHRCRTDEDRIQRLRAALPKLSAMGGSGLIYVMTRKASEEIAAQATDALRANGQRAAAYHAGMESDDRKRLQEQWLAGEIHVLVATNAFGMGIDKPDVRFVVHAGYPESLEGYYQEAGRAGRDGRRSRCAILTTVGDRRTREWFIQNEAVTAGDIETAHAHLCSQWGDDRVRVPRNWRTRTLGWPENKTRLTLRALERAGLVAVTAEGIEDTALEIRAREISAQALWSVMQELERVKTARYRRLAEMLSYCRTTGCRRKTILDYFGDRAELSPSATCCDNCDSTGGQARHAEPETASGVSSKARRSRVAAPARVDPTDVHAVLQGLDALPTPLGRRRLAQVLTGSELEDVQRYNSCPVFGVFSGCTIKRVESFLVALLDAGLLRKGDEDEYFVWTVTDAGRRAWQERQPIAAKPPVVSRSVDEMTEDDRVLFEALRTWRRRQSELENVPPYVVLSDRTLLAITATRPLDQASLTTIAGMGPVKVERHGTAVLQVVRQVAGNGSAA